RSWPTSFVTATTVGGAVDTVHLDRWHRTAGTKLTAASERATEIVPEAVVYECRCARLVIRSELCTNGVGAFARGDRARQRPRSEHGKSDRPEERQRCASGEANALSARARGDDAARRGQKKARQEGHLILDEHHHRGHALPVASWKEWADGAESPREPVPL